MRNRSPSYNIVGTCGRRTANVISAHFFIQYAELNKKTISVGGLEMLSGIDDDIDVGRLQMSLANPSRVVHVMEDKRKAFEQVHRLLRTRQPRGNTRIGETGETLPTHGRSFRGGRSKSARAKPFGGICNDYGDY